MADGYVRIGDDAASDLRVKVLVVADRLSVITDAVEVGAWPVRTVQIVQVDDDRFDLTIDGDSIGFFPDSPEQFGAFDIVSKAPEPGKRRRARRLPKEDSAPATAQSEERQPTAGSKVKARNKKQERSRARTESRRLATAARVEERRHRRHSEAALETKVEARKARLERSRVRAKARRAVRAARAEERQRRKRLRANRSHPMRDRLVRRVSAMRQRAGDRTRFWLTRARWRARLAWYRALDELRQIDGFPFNRIPIISDEKHLEPGHEHSFEAHTAPAGIIREVCECGKIRLASRPIELEGPAYMRSKEPAD